LLNVAEPNRTGGCKGHADQGESKELSQRTRGEKHEESNLEEAKETEARSARRGSTA